MCRQIKQGTKVELPLWLAEMLAVRYEVIFLLVQRRIASFDRNDTNSSYIYGFLPFQCFIYLDMKRHFAEHYALQQDVEALLKYCSIQYTYSPEFLNPHIQFY